MEKIKPILISLGTGAIAFIATLIFFLMISGENPSAVFFICLIIFLVAIPVTSSVFVYKKMSIQNGVETQKAAFLLNMHGKLTLVGGSLNLPSGTTCKVKYNPNQITFSANGQEFILESSKMIDVSIMTQTDIQKQYVSSAGGAIAGALLLGPLGAIIGGSPSKKSIKSKQKYLVFSYISNDETNYIVFDITKDTAAGNRIKATYNFLKKNEKVKVEL
ncbi:hypothetical protein [uncultured Flavonifractor sp.]|uniref:hypothetical protein n=1 Tax=uncultured Flavonifractor sp. TaxID=1193534 RepID=UPI0026112A94|nr:hypothetical protein [uncultured Flavonifractor sp.]